MIEKFENILFYIENIKQHLNKLTCKWVEEKIKIILLFALKKFYYKTDIFRKSYKNKWIYLF